MMLIMGYAWVRGLVNGIGHAKKLAGFALGIVAIVSGATGLAQAQSFGSKPYFLVARPDMADPTFRKAVILMLPSSSEQVQIVAGVIVNSPMRLTLDYLFEHMESLKHKDEHVYFGGPVDYSVPLMLTRGTKPTGHAVAIMDNLYVSGGVETVAEIVSHPWSPKDARLFLGRAQWDRQQLRGEILKGAWDPLPLNLDLLFSPDPKSVWPALQKQSHYKDVERRVTPFASLAFSSELMAE